MLRLLLEHSGEVVTRKEVQKALWPGGTVVDFDHGVATALKKLRRALGDDAAHPRYIETLPRRGYRCIARVEWVEAEGEEKNSNRADEVIDSIAVLPFANLGGEHDYFSDGLAEEILNLLTKIAGLRVIGRTSSFAFRGKKQDIAKIAQTLRVRAILKGSVRRAGNRIRVTAQLIDAHNRSHLWSERYDRELADLFAVQDEIAEAIWKALQLKLLPQPSGTIRHPPNLPAYEAYLKGRHEMSSALPESQARAVEYFRQAAALDPQWADPHAQIGYSHYLAGLLSVRPMLEMAPLARAGARRALELSPFDPMGHAVLGMLAAVVDYDWKGAEEQFRLARTAPSSRERVRGVYALHLTSVGHYEEAIQELDQLITQDPLLTTLRRTRSYVHLLTGMWERAITDAREAVALGDRSWVPPMHLAWSSFYLGNLTEARQHAEELGRLAPQRANAMLAGILMQSGDQEGAARLLPTFADIPLMMFFYHLFSSDTEAAIDCYEKVIEQRYPLAPGYAFARFCKPLHQSPRWPKLEKMMNLPVNS